MKKIIVFDLDGTLLDTLDDLAAAVNFALRSEALPERSIDEVRRFVGNGIRLLVERSVPDGTEKTVLERVFAAFKAYYSENCMRLTKEYDGMTGLLKALKRSGARLGVVTNKSDAPAKVLIEHYFPSLFDSVVGEREGVRKKPEPYSVIETVRSLGGSISDAVYVGDSEVDVLTAANAGTELVCVTWGFRTRQQLLDCGAPRLADDTEGLFEELCKLN